MHKKALVILLIIGVLLGLIQAQVGYSKEETKVWYRPDVCATVGGCCPEQNNKEISEELSKKNGINEDYCKSETTEINNYYGFPIAVAVNANQTMLYVNAIILAIIIPMFYLLLVILMKNFKINKQKKANHTK